MNYFITGASRGIGFELTSQLLTLGENVVACARTPEKAKDLQILAREYPKQCQMIACDVNDEKSVAKALGEVHVDHLDVVVNCAGILLNYDGSIEKFNVDELKTTMQTNLYGPIFVTKYAVNLLKKSSSPKLVNITSQMGSIADNSSGNAYAYRISKTALNMFSKNLSLSEPWLCVLMLHPGWVQTDMGGAHALVAPQESVHGLINVITSASQKDSGRFLNFRNEEIPW